MENSNQSVLDLVYDKSVRECLLHEVQHSIHSIKIATFHMGYFKELMPYLENKDTKIILNSHFMDRSTSRRVLMIGKKLKDVAYVKFLRDLHAKLYIFDDERVVLGSVNLTKKSLFHNHEIAIFTNVQEIVDGCLVAFEDWWLKGKEGI